MIKARKVRGRKTIYSHNKNYFDEVTNESCYWAGFIAADGHIRSNHNTGRLDTLCIDLGSKDREHLETFCKHIEYTGIIGDYLNNSYSHASLTINQAVEVISDLSKNFNVYNFKSKILEPPTFIEESHMISYMVGLIDGDGSIFSTTDKWNNTYLNLAIASSTSEILEWFKSWFDLWYPNYQGRNAKVRKLSSSNSFTYSVIGIRAENILHKLNCVDLPRLNRKWERLNKSEILS